MKRSVTVAALLPLFACGDAPTQPLLEDPASFSVVDVAPGLKAETYDLADGSGCEDYPPGTYETADGVSFTTFTGLVREGPAHSGPCAFEGMTLDLTNSADGAATWTSVWILPPAELWAEPTYPVDIFLYGPFTSTTVEVPTVGWSELVLPVADGVTGWSLSALFGAAYDDLTYTVVQEGPSDPETKDDCKKGGWEAYGFKNQGQCVRFVETGKDSR